MAHVLHVLTFSGDRPQRVNKWLGQSGVCSRRDAESLIAAGRIVIDGTAISEPGHQIMPGQTLEIIAAGDAGLQGASRFDAARTFVLNKPVGWVSAHPNPGEIPAVLMLTAQRSIAGAADDFTHLSLAPLGRLDQDSHGLLLLSEDGVLAKAVIGPDSPVDKEYLVEVEGVVTPEKLKRLRTGITLDGRPLRRAIIQQLGPQSLRFVLREGRNRQIRRMCSAVGLDVVELERVRIGPVSLGDLPTGYWRLMTAEERAALLKAAA
ncbi:MAG: rRNA pseudouridine synthase [Hyphomonadaceae bacterium]|jgi:23S rRNA pseudouridine2604 synthase|nr:rRNA pseudouridine synthase [Hyphomonadaceae bacterium]